MSAQCILHVGFILEACKPMTDAWGQSLKPGRSDSSKWEPPVSCWHPYKEHARIIALGSFSSYIEIIRFERVTLSCSKVLLVYYNSIIALIEHLQPSFIKANT